MKPIRYALVGLGRISKKHIEGILAQGSSACIKAVCDTDSEVLEKARLLTGGKAYRDLATLLNDDEIDVVTIMTPSGLHPAQAILCAKAKKHVVLEKPMGTDWEYPSEMVKCFRENSTKLFVVKQNRLNKPILRLKQALDEGKLGKIYMISSNLFWSRPQSYYDQADWRGTMKYDGGAFMNQANHYIDMLRWLGGEVESVFAYTGTLGRQIEVEDTGVAIVKFKSGAIGSLNVTTLLFKSDLEGSVIVIGEKGTIKVGGIALNKMEIWDVEGESLADWEMETDSYETQSVWGMSHKLYYEEITKSLSNQKSLVVEGDEAFKSHELLMGIYASSLQQREIRFPMALNTWTQ